MLFLCSGRRASSVHWFLLSLDHSSPVSLFGISGPSRRSCFGEEDCSPSTVTQGPIFWAWVWETPRPPTAPLPLSSAASHCLPHGQHTPHTRPFPLQGLLPSLPYQLPTLLGSQHVQCWGGVWQDTGTVPGDWGWGHIQGSDWVAPGSGKGWDQTAAQPPLLMGLVLGSR